MKGLSIHSFLKTIRDFECVFNYYYLFIYIFSVAVGVGEVGVENLKEK